MQARTLGLKLFEPQQYALRVSAAFHQRDEVLYRALDFAKVPRPPAIGLNARGFQSPPLGRIFAHDFGDNAVVKQIALNCAERALLNDAGGDRRVIIANAGVAPASAEEAWPLAAACGDIGAPAASVLHQTGEKVRRLAFCRRGIATGSCLP